MLLRVRVEIDELRRQRDDAEGRMKELQKAGDEAWDDMKAGFDEAWDSVSRAFKSARSRFM